MTLDIARLLKNRFATALIAAVFGIFVVTRFFRYYRSLFYVDAYLYYIPAGRAYWRGVSPFLVNNEHPPLAKYIIGAFVAAGLDPTLSSKIFGIFAGVVVFMVATGLLKSRTWGSIPVFLLAFEPIFSIGTWDPALEIFMTCFELVGLYFLISDRMAPAGVSFGLALASKLTAAFFVIPAIILLVIKRRLRAAALAISAIVAGYLIAYLPAVAAFGPVAFLDAQYRMVSLHLQSQAAGGVLWYFPLVQILLFTVGYRSAITFYPKAPLGTFELFGTKFFFNGLALNLLVTSLLFPALIFTIKFRKSDEKVNYLLAPLSGILVSIMISPPLQHYAVQLIPLTAITETLLFRGLYLANHKWFVIRYLLLVPLWTLLAVVLEPFFYAL